MSTKTYQNLVLCLCILILCSCGKSSELDRVFRPGTYKKEYQILFRAADVSNTDLFLINYLIMRHQDYFGYEIEGKTYRELLSMAKQFQKDGMPITEVYERNGEQEKVIQLIQNSEAGSIRRADNPKKIIRALLFDCTYENKTEEDVVILSSSFLINGPFKKRISAAGYEVNCVLKAGEKTTINFALEGKTIIDNLKHEANNYTEYSMVDSLFQNLDIQVAGNSLQSKTTYFDVCNYKTRIEPFEAYRISEDENFKSRRSKQADGSTKIDWGKAHYMVKEQKEPINMQ